MSHECFADEIAIDFPVGRTTSSSGCATRFLGERADGDVLRAEVSLSSREASTGTIVPLERADARHLPALRRPRRNLDRAVRRLPRQRRLARAIIRSACRCRRGVADGARFRFRVSSPHARAGARRSARRRSAPDRRSVATILRDCTSRRAGSPAVSRRLRRHPLHRLGPADDSDRRVDAGARHRRRRAHRVGEPRRRRPDRGRPDGGAFTDAGAHRHRLGRSRTSSSACRCGGGATGRASARSCSAPSICCCCRTAPRSASTRCGCCCAKTASACSHRRDLVIRFAGNRGMLAPSMTRSWYRHFSYPIHQLLDYSIRRL